MKVMTKTYPLSALIRSGVAAKGVSDSQAARDLGVSRQCFSNWKRGVARPFNPATAEQVRRYFNIGAEEWLREAAKGKS